MIKLIKLFWVLALISSCKSEIAKPVYDSIELSFSSGWPYAFSLKIDSANVVSKCDYKIISKIESVKCFCDTLSQSSVDSLNYFVSELKNRKPDSVYAENCQDCSWYTIRINETEGRIESEITGDRHKNLIDSLADFILRHSYGMKNRVDTVYSFPLTERLVPTPPPMQVETKFTPLRKI
ncbi:hypothetical protein [Sabulibacter ruber]|uniref:hypothetical protein n=1 Tax=Sabulibacter ruber TaxID=2811901 RepID=UPI001A9605D0|nr:hypothetical protein [Sabulibacter ruber]